MVILDDEEYNKVWDIVYDRFNFNPSVDKKEIAFKFKEPYIVYDISYHYENLEEIEGFVYWGFKKEIRDKITEIFLKCTKENGELYALDWQHSCFRYNPRIKDEPKIIEVKDERYWGGGYTAYFPTYCPNGDYYFFIDVNFHFGYLGHPWQQKVWIYGKKLIEEFKKADLEGFKLIEEKN